MATTGRSTQQTIVGVYTDSSLVEKTLKELYRVGFSNEQIMLASKERGTRDLDKALASLGMLEHKAQYYQREVEAGHVVLIVNAGERQQEATDILRHNGAYNVGQLGETPENVATLPLREEQLTVNKQMVVSGAVRIHKRVVTEEKTITVQVSREEIFVERIPDQPSASSTYTNDHYPNDKVVLIRPGESFIIPLRTEQVFIEKRPVVTEEVIVRKLLVQGAKQVSETVQKEVPIVGLRGNVMMQGEGVKDAVNQPQAQERKEE
jgi:uncharacterized protein (TIGR02271 family)